jgi:phenylacetate-CoA ligase
MSQLDRLRALLAELTPGNRFYARRLAADGVDAHAITSLEDFSKRVSFTHKQDLVVDQAAHPPYGSNHTYPLELYTRFCQTSGTTARPLVILDTPESWEWMLGNWAAIYRAAGLTPGERIYFAFSFGPFLGFWTAFDSAARSGYLGIPGGGLGSAARVRAMIQHRATVLCCTPTYALRLAQAAVEEQIDLREVGGSQDHRRGRAGWQHSGSAKEHQRGLARRGGPRSLRHDRSRSGRLSNTGSA